MAFFMLIWQNQPNKLAVLFLGSSLWWDAYLLKNRLYGFILRFELYFTCQTLILKYE